MSKRIVLIAVCWLALWAVIAAGQVAAEQPAGPVQFVHKPSAMADDEGIEIAFEVSAPTDVEVAVLGADGKVVRHLAAGVLGGKNPPPAPLKAGLAQEILWDSKDDFGKPAAGGPFKARVRAGMGAKLGRFIGQDPYHFGAIDSMVMGDDGNLYILGASALGGWETVAGIRCGSSARRASTSRRCCLSPMTIVVFA